MNEFIEQFLIEARELVGQGTADLLAAEQRPGDAEAIAGAFRAFHTLKGAAGIIDFAAMARALHAAEDALSAVRSGARPLDHALIGRCLACLDQVIAWLDLIEQSGEPPADAEGAADDIVALFAPGSLSPPVAEDAPDPVATLEAWLAALWLRRPELRARARTALRHEPERDSFFRGEDPLRRIAPLPGLLAVDIVPHGTPVPLAESDPFACELAIFAVSSEPAVVLAPFFAGLSRQPVWQAFDPAPAPAAPNPVDDLLAAQIALLEGPDDEGFEGRRAAALATAINVLRAAGEGAAAAEVERLAGEGAGPSALIAALRRDAPATGHTPGTGHAPGAGHTPEPAAPAEDRAGSEPAARSLRVDIARVDALVRLAGEFTVLMNAAGHAAALAQRGEGRTLAPVLKQQHAALERLVDELQHAVLAIRVLPLRHVFQRFPRLVRDMAQALDKPLRLVIEGEATEADKAIVEALFEPLLHILRNAADHGIEPVEARRAAGKPETGLVILRARREEGRLVVEVEDDGGGVDTARIRTVAAARGMAGAEALAALTEDEAMDLIFAPGFSTRREVTGYSGRGVGMDAVRVAVERLGGRVALRSRPGRGACVRLDLPVSVMKTEVMTVEVGGQVVGLPLDVVVETARVPRAALARIGAARAFVWRERTVPLLDLSGVLAAEGARPSPEALVVVTRVAGAYAGLEVDRFGQRMSVMLRPMEGLLAGLPCLGTTLLGDGRVLLVLDLHELQL